MRGMTTGRSWKGLALAGVLVLAACGSTVDPDRLAAYAQDPDAGLGVTDPTGDPGPGGPDGGPTDGGPGGVDGGPGGVVDPTAPPPGGPVVPGIGVTKDSIAIGVVVVEDQSEANAALGAGGVTGGDGKAYAEVMIKDINSRGIAGRKLVPVYDTISSVSNETMDAQLAGVCETFTQDEKVHIVEGVGQSESFAACIERAGVSQVVSNFSTSDTRTFQKYPHYVEPIAINLNRSATATVDSLARRGYFGGGVKVGVLTYDSPTFDYALRTSLLPALARHGVDPLVEQVTENQRLSDLTAESAQVSSVVLSFNSAGVDNVIIFERSGSLALFFMNAADGQEYTPRYGLNSQSGNSALVGLVPERQLRDALSIGWTTSTDLSAEDGAKAPRSPSRKRCVKLMNDAGLTFDSTNAEAIAVNTCDDFWLIERSLSAGAVNGVVTADSFLIGLHSLGTSFPGSDGFGTRFGPTQHDGLAEVADMAFMPACSCFQYTSKPYAIP
jgi:hypothetical protein